MLVNYRQEGGMDNEEENNSSSCHAAEEEWRHKNFSSAQCSSSSSSGLGGFPISSVSSYAGGYSSSTLLQNLFADDDGAHNPHPQHSSLLYNNNNYQVQANLNQFLAPELLISPLMTNSSPLVPKQTNTNFCTSNPFASQSQSITTTNTIISDHKPNNLLKVTTGHGKVRNNTR